jgi:hypothetical protein
MNIVNRRKTKKTGVVSALTALSLIVNIFLLQPTSAAGGMVELADELAKTYINGYPQYETEIRGIVSHGISNSEFKRIFESEGAAAFAIVERAILDMVDPPAQPRLVGTGIFYLPYATPYVNQAVYNNGVLQDYYCGPASTIQALIGNGKLANNAYNKSEANVRAVGTSLGTNSSGTLLYRITNYMNSYGYGGNSYESLMFTPYNYTSALSYVRYSLANNGAVIMRVPDTRVLGYYNGNNYSHYMTIVQVNEISSTMVVVDPHYDSAYAGQHTITFAEFYNCVNVDGWLSALT